MIAIVGLELLMLPTPRYLCVGGGFALWGQLSRPFLNTLDLPKYWFSHVGSKEKSLQLFSLL
jgi:hypothetical protein